MKKRGNISLLVMFVLVACSLLGLLAVHFLKNMSTQYDQITSYYKSYYLAKAGIETALTQLQHRGLGFSETIGESDTLVKANIQQPKSSFRFSVLGRSNFLSMSLLDTGNCDNPFTIYSGQTLVLPLFSDVFEGGIADSLSTAIHNENLGVTLAQLSPIYKNVPGPVNLGLLLSDDTGLYPNGIYFNKLTTWDKNSLKSFATSASTALGALEDIKLETWATYKGFTPYLVVANKDRLPVSFCLSLPKGVQLPTQQYLIQSFGHYGDTQLNLEATYRQPMPSFLVDSELGLK